MKEIRMLAQNDDYLTPEKARRKGVSKYGFYKFIRENELERIARGVYSKEDVLVDDLYLINSYLHSVDGKPHLKRSFSV